MTAGRERAAEPVGSEGAGPGVLHEFFERAARQWPRRVAVEIPPGAGRPVRGLVTYGELAADANALAERIRPFIQGECVAGILLPRTAAHLYSAQLAVLKAGAAYTCIDPSFPDDRIWNILEDAGVVVLLTDPAGLARLRSWRPDSFARLDVGAELMAPLGPPAASRPGGTASWLTPESLAYIIYTSGTTGRPKGVMIEHRSICNLVTSDLETFRLSPADRVAQGSSAAYDSSVEETWLALAAGATVVVLDEGTARLGPDLIPWLRRERITVFCPPPTLLRATGCADPEGALPDLKLLYVGGEALPRDVADRWSRGRILVNGYGPTECTVTCLRERITEGRPIPIGRAVRGVKAWTLNPALEEAARGEPGELCIGGIALARGYSRDPELTAQKFVTHPRWGRIYRTGDLVHQDESGRFFCHGRLDSQVKLRGYRIELGELESHLARCRGVRSAACCVREDHGQAALVAFIVPEDPSQPPSPRHLRAALATTLPEYMVPAHYGFLPELPTTVGGKLNRAALPRLKGAEEPAGTIPGPPLSPVEGKIEAAFREILRPARPLSRQHDFFKDLAGDSLSAALVITLLRADPATASLAVRDLYEAPTIAGLARSIIKEPAPASPASVSPGESPSSPVLTTILQTAWLVQSLALGSILAYYAGFHGLPRLTQAIGLAPLLLLGPPFLLVALTLYAPVAVALAVLAKKILIGRYEPSQAPVWGSFFRRNWLVLQMVKLIPWWLLEGTEFQNTALRALGARIGRRVHLHRGVDLRQGGWDLLEIGDDVTVSQDATLQLVELESGKVILGRIKLGTGSTLDIHSSVAGNTSLEPGAYLAARSMLPPGGHISSGERWDGIPARPAGKAPRAPALPAGERVLPPYFAGLLLLVSRLTLLAVLALPAELIALLLARTYGFNVERAMTWWSHPALDARGLLCCALVAVAPTPLLLALEALACRGMGPVQEGVSSRWSPGYIKMWLKAGLVDSASRWLYGTLFWPVWLRLAGMKVGPGCELSSLIDTIPENVEIGANTFCADGIYLGGPKIHRGTVTVARVKLGRNNFIGNGAIIAGGEQLPDDVLLGVCTVAAAAPVRPGTGWFGHPPFELPRREVIAFDRRLTHEPSFFRHAVRFFWEGLRFALPVTLAIVVPLWFHLVEAAREVLAGPVFLLVAVPVLSLGTCLVPPFLIIALKWTLLGRVRPGVHPLWSSWASRWDFICLAWNLYAAEAVSALNGTLYLNVLLRLMGVNVGRGVILGHGIMDDLPDPDMLTLEDGATVDCLFQAHTFEDRVLKVDRIIIRRRASVGRHAVLLYGADIGAGARVSPNSVVMKHERLPAHQRYAGSPLRQTD